MYPSEAAFSGLRRTPSATDSNNCPRTTRGSLSERFVRRDDTHLRYTSSSRSPRATASLLADGTTPLRGVLPLSPGIAVRVLASSLVRANCASVGCVLKTSTMSCSPSSMSHCAPSSPVKSVAVPSGCDGTMNTTRSGRNVHGRSDGTSAKSLPSLAMLTVRSRSSTKVGPYGCLTRCYLPRSARLSIYLQEWTGRSA